MSRPPPPAFKAHDGQQQEALRSSADYMLLGGARGGGKQMPLTSSILTPDGYKELSQIKVGDTICGVDGKPQKIIYLHPITYEKQYVFYFDNNESIISCGDHLWYGGWRQDKSDFLASYDNPYCIKTAKQIYEHTLFEKKEKKRRWFKIPLHKAIEFNSKKCLIDPYLLGLLLGDGCITNPKYMKITTNDIEHIKNTLDNLEITYRTHKFKNKNCYDVFFNFESKKRLIENLTILGLMGHSAETKFIPDSYKFVSIKDRLSILQGILDTDGCIGKEKGSVRFYSISEDLAEDVCWVARSLGFRTSINSRQPRMKGKYFCKECYIVQISSEDNSKLFRLERKSNLAKSRKRGLFNTIVDAEIIEEKVPMRCITVSNPNGLYIVDNFIVTHNSLLLAWLAALRPRLWHYENKMGDLSTKAQYLKKGTGVKVVVDKISIDYPEYTALIIRRSYPMLEKNLKPECDKLYTLDCYGGVWRERDHCYIFPSGSRVYLVHCQDYNALRNYIGGNYNFIGIDEANQFPEDWVEKLDGSLRSSSTLELTPYMVLTSNPGDIGHLWLKKRFVDKCPPILVGDQIYNKNFDVWYQPKKAGKPYKDEEGLTYQFIPMTVFDNPSILKNDPKYVRRLKRMNETLRRMWLHGDWDAPQGMYFDNWNPEFHVISAKNFKIDREVDRLYRFYDYGTKVSTAVLFACVKPDGDMVIFDELIMTDGEAYNEFEFPFDTSAAASVQAKMVIYYTKKRHGLETEDFFDEIADSQMWQQVSAKEDELYSAALFFEDAGIFLTSTGKKDRVAGAAVVYNGFNIPDNGVPRIRFTDNCQYCIETIPSLPTKENLPDMVEDKRTKDHAYDALKYGTIHIFGKLTNEPEEKKGWRDWIKEEATEGEGHNSWMRQGI